MSDTISTPAKGASIFPSGTLRGPAYDSLLVFGTLLVALTAGALVTNEPRLFYPVLLIDLWFFGYQHVVATYTRLCFDAASARQYRFYLTGLPAIVLLATVAMALGVGIWSVVTLYLYWQWFHYTRQSWGVGRAYARKSGIAADDWLTKAAFYLPPLWGILYRSWQAPDKFLGLEVRTLPVPGLAVDIVAVLAIACAGVWLVRRARAVLRNEEPPLYMLYGMTHLIAFGTGYVFLRDINAGWLVINVWHNTQYLLFVWLYNSRRYGDGAEPQARLLTSISKPQRWPLYVVACLAVTFVFYGLLNFLANLAFPATAVAFTLIFYQAVNFHHYVVDSFIWKLRKSPMQAALGLTPADAGKATPSS